MRIWQLRREVAACRRRTPACPVPSGSVRRRWPSRIDEDVACRTRAGAAAVGVDARDANCDRGRHNGGADVAVDLAAHAVVALVDDLDHAFHSGRPSGGETDLCSALRDRVTEEADFFYHPAPRRRRAEQGAHRSCLPIHHLQPEQFRFRAWGPPRENRLAKIFFRVRPCRNDMLAKGGDRCQGRGSGVTRMLPSAPTPVHDLVVVPFKHLFTRWLGERRIALI
jgi:hypothetical protein